jgi:hypothetical protein
MADSSNKTSIQIPKEILENNEQYNLTATYRGINLITKTSNELIFTTANE